MMRARFWGLALTLAWLALGLAPASGCQPAVAESDGCSGDGCDQAGCGSEGCQRPPGDPACYDLPAPCDEGACLYRAVDLRPCDDGDPCTTYDRCLADGSCRGTALACDSPPASTCQDAATLRVFESPGSCALGDCSYTSTAVSCAEGCDDDACLGDPCAGLYCDSPPSPRCEGASTVRTFTAPGTCRDGICDYPASDRHCAGGCVDGACADDGCDQLTCDQPPDDACSDAHTLQRYPPTGTCAGGECRYTPTTVTCDQGCADGACLGCQPAWSDVSSCGCTPSACQGCSGQKTQDDGCGHSRDVGCTLPQLGCAGPCCQGACCGGDDVCDVGSGACCTPSCGGKACGPDGCGGSCGDCAADFACQLDGSCRLQSSCQGPSAPGATVFGFNYAPQEHLCKWVGSEFGLVEEVFERDLEVMASLGTAAVRVMLLPYCLGTRMQAGAAGDWDQAELDAVAQNLPWILSRFADHGVVVIPAFGPNAYYWNGPTAEQKYWQIVYGDSGWGAFVDEMVAWSTRLVEIVETSGACDQVPYYDLQNEVDYGVPGMSQLVTALLQRVPLPDSKRGLSLLRASQAAQLRQDVQASGVALPWLEFHVYPDRGLHSDVVGTAAALAGSFPASALVVGELGSVFCESGQDEDAERDVTLAAVDGAFAADVAAALHWMLWDRTPGTSCAGVERVGLGFGPSAPRDVYGALAGRLGLIPNNDFEASLDGWFMGGTGTPIEASASLLRMGPQESDAATNLYYGRLRVQAPGTYWVCSPTFDVSGARLAVSGLVRSNRQQLGLDAHFLAGDQDLGFAGLGFEIPAGWAFNSIQHSLGGRAFDIPAGADRAFVCAVVGAPEGTSATDLVYLDLDAMSAHGYSPR